MDMSDERIEYLSSGEGAPADLDRLDTVRELLTDETTWAESPPEVGDRVLAAIAGLAANGRRRHHRRGGDRRAGDRDRLHRRRGR